MIKSPNPVPCPPGILKVFEDHVETIRRTRAVGDIIFDAKTGEIKANKHCPMCDGMMDIHNDHGEAEFMSWILAGNSPNLSGPFETVSLYAFECRNCGLAIPIE